MCSLSLSSFVFNHCNNGQISKSKSKQLVLLRYSIVDNDDVNLTNNHVKNIGLCC